MSLGKNYAAKVSGLCYMNLLHHVDTYYKMRGGNLFNTLILSVDLFKLHNKSASLMVLGFDPLHKSIIPRRSFFDKPHFLSLTGMFSLIKKRSYSKASPSTVTVNVMTIFFRTQWDTFFYKAMF